jgi:hypothetical protein
VTVSRRLATAQSDHDGRNQNPREGCAALVLITILSAGLGQLGSGRRGCHRHHKHQARCEKLLEDAHLKLSSVITPGTWKNFQLVGHDPLFGRGMSAAATIFRHYMYIGNRTDGSATCGVGDPRGPGSNCPHPHPGY